MDLHASSHVEDLRNEDDHTTTSSTPLALFYEAHDTHTCDEQVDGTYDADFGSTNTKDSTSCLRKDAYNKTDVLAPKYDKDLTMDELPFEADFISHELYMKEDKEEVDFWKCEDRNKSEILMGIIPMSPAIWQGN